MLPLVDAREIRNWTRTEREGILCSEIGRTYPIMRLRVLEDFVKGNWMFCLIINHFFNRRLHEAISR